MEIKKLKNKIQFKNGVSILDVFLIVVMGIFCFGSFFFFVTTLASENDIDVPSRYNDSYQDMLDDQAEIQSTTEEIRDIMGDLEQASTIQQVAFNGILGVLALFKLPLKIINPVFSTLNLALDLFDIIPSTVIVSISIGILIILTFALLRFVTQRGNDA